MHYQIPYNLAKNEYPQDSDVAMVEYTEQPTMGGDHGGKNNNDNNMPLHDVAVVENTKQPTMGGEQGVNNNDNNMPQAPLKKSLRTLNNLRWVGSREVTMRTNHPSNKLSMKGHNHRSVPSPPSPRTKTPAIHQMINSYELKKKSSDVDLFLIVLKNKPK
jgi:hypothetical protein